MKRILQSLFFFAVVIGSTNLAQAQIQTHPKSQLMQGQIEHPYTGWNKSQWKALRKQLDRLTEVPAGQIDAVTMQNIIYFATYFPYKAKLGKTSSNLLEVYQTHEREDYRILALSALHAIGDPVSMEMLHENVDAEPSARVRRITLAVLKDYYGAE